jgi:hypothetical protein
MLSLVFPGSGNLLCRGSMHKRCRRGLRGYGLIVFRRRRSSFRSTMILGVREGNLYRMRDQLMHSVTSRSIETVEEEQGDPPVVRQVAPPIAQREQVAPSVVRQVAPIDIMVAAGGIYLHV